jgi:hypothetical protein
MDTDLRDYFTALFEKYFPGPALPLAIEFRDRPLGAKEVPYTDGWRCIICQMGLARNGTPLSFDAGAVTCRGCFNDFSFFPLR